MRESMGRLWMLKNTAPLAHRFERRREAPTVIAKFLLPRRPMQHRPSAPVSTPAIAWRVSNNRMRTGIQPGVSFFVPRINARQIPVTSVPLDKKSANQWVNSDHRPRSGFGGICRFGHGVACVRLPLTLARAQKHLIARVNLCAGLPDWYSSACVAGMRRRKNIAGALANKAL
jgi:hypothetical protein